ncbi:hypothetical protein BDN71DRAFT_1450020 [Pleurotus eryngii]|uniref:F-box domain-containing protein n=1 Tax=Pleurotus eryngii TaxID=5323 RepID=A0A9P5ZSQ8_PLEER|nr:hypothetical protein BDN71DRAFT_1450020 [Pleurotus eryngii]
MITVQASTRLPPELIIKTIAFLDDRMMSNEEWQHKRSPLSKIRCPISPSLISASRVCHTWNDFCRPLIFSRIYIDCEGFMEYADYAALHFEMPHLCKHIRELSLNITSAAAPPPEWLDDCLSRFTNLKELELRNCSEFAQPGVNPSFVRAISASLLPNTSLKCLALIGFRDASDLLLVLSACSTTLEDLMIHCRQGEYSPATTAVVPSVLHMEALRSLELYLPPAPFTQADVIECPNLQTLFVFQESPVPWELPSWIPASISELIVQVPLGAPLPRFGQPIRPSSLTIQLDAIDGDITWIEGCTARLPFLDHLRQLAIKVVVDCDYHVLTFPESSLYEALCRLLQPLQQRPTLQAHIILYVFVESHIDLEADALDILRRRETARLEEAFAPSLKAGALSVQLVFRYWGDDDIMRHQTLVLCSV